MIKFKFFLVMLTLLMTQSLFAAKNIGKFYSDKFIICDIPSKGLTQLQNQTKYRPDTLKTIGFIHCSRPRQLEFVANKFFAQQQYTVWVVDPKRVNSPIKYETYAADTYPHIYGPLNLNAIVATYTMNPKKDGTYEVPQELKTTG